MNSANFALKLSEKSRSGDKRGPQGHRSGHYSARLGSYIPAKSTFGASLKPLFRQFLNGVLGSSDASFVLWSTYTPLTQEYAAFVAWHS